VCHPSQPNYFAAIAGDYFDYDDDSSHNLSTSYKTVVDLLEAEGLTWRTYQENMPSVCYTGSSSRSLYYRKHNPFISFDLISKDANRCKNVVPSTQLQADLDAGYLPNYSFYTPNIKNDGHDTTVDFASKWFSGFLAPLLANPTFNNNTLVVLTFDEADDYTDETNHILGMLLGDAVKDIKNTVDSTFYTHYSLISTVTSNWGLGNLGRNDINKPLSNVFSFVAALTGYQNVDVTNPPPLN
jgi:acid phosphatase